MSDGGMVGMGGGMSGGMMVIPDPMAGLIPNRFKQCSLGCTGSRSILQEIPTGFWNPAGLTLGCLKTCIDTTLLCAVFVPKYDPKRSRLQHREVVILTPLLLGTRCSTQVLR